MDETHEFFQGFREFVSKQTELVKQMALENNALRAQVAALTAALETIAACTYCMGPGCPYCEGDGHPPSHEARIARRALGRE